DQRPGNARPRRQGCRGFRSQDEGRLQRNRTGEVIDTTPHLITSFLAMGMALAFVVADRSSPPTRALGLFLASIGVSLGVGSQIAYPLHHEGNVAWWDGLFAIPESAAFFFAYEWILRVRRTVPAAGLKTKGPDRLLRIAQGLSVFYLLMAL